MLLRLLLVLLLVWIAITVLGVVVKGLFWLAVVGVLFFLVTAAFGGARRR
jgi:hypothetical protein